MFGIILGVTAMFSINDVNKNAYESITRLFEGTSGKVSLEVQSAARVGGFSEDILPTVSGIEGVLKAVPVIIFQGALTEEVPQEISVGFFGTGSGGIICYGIDAKEDQTVRDYMVTKGTFIEEGASDNQILLVEDYAKDNDILVGQSITLLTSTESTELKVVGLLKKDRAGLVNSGKIGIMDLVVAQDLLKREGEIDKIELLIEPNKNNTESLDQLKEELSQTLGEDYLVSYSANQGEQMSQMLTSYQIGLNFMAGIALFVGAFLIYNTLSMTVAERSRELGLLRCVGMTRKQVTLQVLFEGLVLGITGAVLGAGVGILLSMGLTELMASILGQELQRGKISSDILFSSMAIGVFVTVLSAFLPAYQAGKISPLEALQVQGKTKSSKITRYGWILGLFLLIGSGGILILNLFPYDVQFRLGSLTVFALFKEPH